MRPPSILLTELGEGEVGLEIVPGWGGERLHVEQRLKYIDPFSRVREARAPQLDEVRLGQRLGQRLVHEDLLQLR